MFPCGVVPGNLQTAGLKFVNDRVRDPGDHTGSEDLRIIETRQRKSPMHSTLYLTPVLSLIAGILILVMPRLLNYIVAVYLILAGLAGLFGSTGL